MKKGDRVELTKSGKSYGKTRFTTGVVTYVSTWGAIYVKRDDYRGHESTIWNREDWSKIR